MSMVDVARDAASRGYFAFLLRERGKTPLTEHGFRDATRDERTILHWWDRWPGANVGIDLERSGAHVVDIDSKHGADPDEVMAALDIEPDAPNVVRTGEAPEPNAELPKSLAGLRGAHIYFAGHAPTVKTALPGVEIRGDGAYAVAPGSMHESGVVYAGALPPVSQLPEAPESVRLLVASGAQSAIAIPDDGEVFEPGSRHELLLAWCRSRYVARGVVDEPLWAAMVGKNLTACRPPLLEHELRRLFRHLNSTRIARSERQRDAARPTDAETHDSGPTEPHARIIDMGAAIKAASDPLPYRVTPLAMDGFVTLLAGRRGDAKTWLGLLACNAVQNAADLAPLDAKKGPALILDAESGARLLGRRFVLLGLEADAFTVADGVGLRLPRDIATVRALVDGVGARLLVLDSLRRLSSGSREDKSDDMEPVMTALATLARETQCAVVLLHNRSTKPNAPDMRGSSALEDQADIVWVLERLGSDPERKTRRRLRNAKMRPDAEQPPLWLSFKTVAGLLTMSEAEPFAGARESGDDGDELQSAHEVMAVRMRGLAEQVRTDHGWPPKRLAAAVGSTSDHGTFKRALGMLLESGEWVGEGYGKGRRVHPILPKHESGQSGNSLGDGPIAGNENGSGTLSNDPSRSAAHGPEGEP